MGGDLDSMVVEGIGDVAAVVQGRCSAVGPGSIHWSWKAGSRSAVAGPGTPFV